MGIKEVDIAASSSLEELMINMGEFIVSVAGDKINSNFVESLWKKMKNNIEKGNINSDDVLKIAETMLRPLGDVEYTDPVKGIVSYIAKVCQKEIPYTELPLAFKPEFKELDVCGQRAKLVAEYFNRIVDLLLVVYKAKDIENITDTRVRISDLAILEFIKEGLEL